MATTFYLSLGIKIHVGISILGIVNINVVGNGEDKVGLISIGASELALGLPFTPTPYFNLKPWYSQVKRFYRITNETQYHSI
jgi:hypothetical protein